VRRNSVVGAMVECGLVWGDMGREVLRAGEYQ
jgi:hypothetical protein